MKQRKVVNTLGTKWKLFGFNKNFIKIGAKDLYIAANLIDELHKTRIKDGQSTIYT